MLACAVLSACATATIEDAVPRGAPQTAAAEGPVNGSVAATEPRNTGQFPNTNVVPAGETEQISNAEKSAAIAELNAAKARAAGAGGGKPQDSVAELKRQARTHAKDTADAIENE